MNGKAPAGGTTAPAQIGCTATAIRKASRRMTALYDAALEPSGLRSTQYAILAELQRRTGGAPTMSELSAALVMDRSALGHNLRPLEREGLVELEAGDDDRRQRHVVITPAGRAKRRAAKRLWQTAQARFDDVVGHQNAAELRRVLTAIAHNERLATLRD